MKVYDFFFVLGVFSAYIFAIAFILLMVSVGITVYEQKSGKTILSLFGIKEEFVKHADKD